MSIQDHFFSGQRLIGDDFTAEQIEEWYRDEEEAYANLGAKDGDPTDYGYHATNEHHGFRFLPASAYENALGIGSAYGGEFLRHAHQIGQLTIVEPSANLRVDEIAGKKVHYVFPEPSGKLPFEDNQFTLVTCFGCLHHIPNVSFVLSELVRCTKPGGYLLVREPIISMGDWTKPRRGLTKRERGIPLHLFRQMMSNMPVEVVREGFLFTGVISTGINRLAGKLAPRRPWNSAFYTSLDALLARALLFNYKYHTTTRWRRFLPSNVFYVLKKRDS